VAVRAFVKSRSERRDLSKGEKAMALAMLYPEPDKRGRGNKGKAEETSDFTQKRLAQARQVLRHSQPFAIAVRDGVEKLDAARTAMALAMLYPEPDKSGRGRKGSATKRAAETAGVSDRRARHALFQTG
jgi:hypothetical protein